MYYLAKSHLRFLISLGNELPTRLDLIHGVPKSATRCRSPLSLNTEVKRGVFLLLQTCDEAVFQWKQVEFPPFNQWRSALATILSKGMCRLGYGAGVKLLETDKPRKQNFGTAIPAEAWLPAWMGTSEQTIHI